MQVKKVHLKYVLFILILIILLLFVYLISSDTVIKPEKVIPKKEIPPALKSEAATKNRSIVPEVLPGISLTENSNPKKKYENEVTGVQICPLVLDIKYNVHHKGTIDNTDDDVYINLKNNKQTPEFVSVEVDDSPEGSLEVVGLGSSEIKSNIITSWWKSRTIYEVKTFNLLIIPKSCPIISSELIVAYPLPEEAYLD